MATTGYHRKHAIRLLKHGVKAGRKKKPGKSKIYQGEVVIALIKIWAICGQICSRRLHPFLPEMVAVNEAVLTLLVGVMDGQDVGVVQVPDQTVQAPPPSGASAILCPWHLRH